MVASPFDAMRSQSAGTGIRNPAAADKEGAACRADDGDAGTGNLCHHDTGAGRHRKIAPHPGSYMGASHGRRRRKVAGGVTANGLAGLNTDQVAPGDRPFREEEKMDRFSSTENLVWSALRFDEGYECRMVRQQGLNQNPYVRGSHAANSWAAGWADADQTILSEGDPGDPPMVFSVEKPEHRGSRPGPDPTFADAAFREFTPEEKEMVGEKTR